MTSRIRAAIEPIAMPTIAPVDSCAVPGGVVAAVGWLDAVELEGEIDVGDSFTADVRDVVSAVVVSDDNVEGVVTVSTVEAVVSGVKVVGTSDVDCNDNVDAVVIVSDVKVVGTGSEISDVVACRCTIFVMAAGSSMVRGPRLSNPTGIWVSYKPTTILNCSRRLND